MFLLLVLVAFGLGYFWWARRLERAVDLRPDRITPAHLHEDGVDYVPTRPTILFGHHYASIAGLGPIVGPVLAVQYGWLPTLLWLVLGVVFIGAVHDFGSLACSARHDGKMVGHILATYLGERAHRLFSLFAVASICLVVSIFATQIAKAFVDSPAAASASILLTIFSVLVGAVNRKIHLPAWLLTAVAIAFCAVAVAAGMRWPVALPQDVWFGVLMAYSFAASVLPVWSLLQPRDFTNFFLLVFFLALGTVGILAGRPELKLPAFTPAGGAKAMGFLFPFMFVTVACGSVSGFHSLVASGTTSKQLKSEGHVRPIGYGGMLLEALLGVISLAAAAVLTVPEYQEMLGPKQAGGITVFSTGVSRIIGPLGLPAEFIKNFSVLALSAFALTSLDTAARLGRYLLEEVAPQTPMRNRYISSGIVITAAVLLTATESAGRLWTLFGTSNQLLAAIALLAVTLWAAAAGYPKMYFLIPAAFMFLVTLTALIGQVWKFYADRQMLLFPLAALLLALAAYLLGKGIRRLRTGKAA